MMDYKNLDCKKLFFTSDTHFGHANIIKFCDRPFKDVRDMNESLIKNWNRVVCEDDIVFHLGDFALQMSNREMPELIHSLNGHKVLIKGNHESCATKSAYVRELFVDVFPIKEIRVIDDQLKYIYQHVTLCHFPMIAWNHSHKGAWHLYGHLHNQTKVMGYKYKMSPRQLEVGVDTNNFEPYHWNDVKKNIIDQVSKHKRLKLT